jgi:hypothetical protein
MSDTNETPAETIERLERLNNHLAQMLKRGSDRLQESARELMAQGWDEGHGTPVQREPDDCRCGAWYEGECGCGKYGTGKIITPNPYRQPIQLPGAAK